MLLPKTPILLLLIALSLFPAAHTYEKEMTVHVDAGKNECFYDEARAGDTIDIEYQVIDGGHGDLDISFTLSDPVGLVIVTDFKKPENIHRHEVSTTGVYRFCFDNTFSTFSRKTVFFELIVDQEGNGYHTEEQVKDGLEGLTPEEYYEMKVQDIMDYIGRIRVHMTKARQLQDMLRSHEARDRNQAESNFMKVNAWSFFQIGAMIAVGLLQVFMVRSIFETGETRLGKFWKRIGM